ncbi:hypothetical protein PV08_01729 [Exophiala spinifera]|uniref:Uncharacterized protein n=1 Tax=Exophiala spinifera TaxID=91928 RepID=A0A0D2CCC9_9EURO|nr:uncharacterized protein PV08_01729 [Exophiala spinifera]KIW21149.1 hypothetical protein PV08_01729 [Exophiala spinifera]
MSTSTRHRGHSRSSSARQHTSSQAFLRGPFDLTIGNPRHEIEEGEIPQSGFRVNVQWYINELPPADEIATIERIAVVEAKRQGCKVVCIRSNIHDTTRMRVPHSRPARYVHVSDPVGWHYTAEMRLPNGDWLPAHFYTETQVINGTKITRGLDRRLGKNNPIVWTTDYFPHVKGEFRREVYYTVFV